LEYIIAPEAYPLRWAMGTNFWKFMEGTCTCTLCIFLSA